MFLAWKVLFCLCVWIVCISVKAQSDEYTDSEEYGDDQFGDNYQNENYYEDPSKKIYNDLFNGQQIERDDAEPIDVNRDEYKNNNEKENNFDLTDDTNIASKGVNEIYETANDDTVGDDNLNGNAPVNDYDPLEMDKQKSEEMNGPNNVEGSPYSRPMPHDSETINNLLINKNENTLDDITVNVKSQINQLEESASDDHINSENYINSKNTYEPFDRIPENILEETEKILNDDMKNDNFEDENIEVSIPEPEINEENDVSKNEPIGGDIPEIIFHETEDLVRNNNDLEDVEEDIDIIINDDIKADLQALLKTKDELQNESANEGNFNSESKEGNSKDEWNDEMFHEKEGVINNNDVADEFNDEWKNGQLAIDNLVKQDSENQERFAEFNAMIEEQPEIMENHEDNDETEDDYQNYYSDENDEKSESDEKENMPMSGVIDDALHKIIFNEVSTASQEINDKYEAFKSLHKADIDLDAAITEVPAIHIALSADTATVVTSPDYPSPYPANNIIDWIFDGEEGTGIEFNITDLFVNGEAGDYLLVKPGGSDVSSNDGIIFTYELRHERNYRFFDVDRMFVRFESKANTNNLYRGFQFSIKFIDHKVERNLDPEPTPEAVAQVPEETTTVFLTGVAPHAFTNISEEFRAILVDMATMYIVDRSIDPGALPLSDVVQLTRVSICNIDWPYHESCSAVTFGIPLFYNTTEQDTDYQLNSEQLIDMWMSFSGIDPFAIRLNLLGITEYGVPNDRAIMSIWWFASFAVLVVVLGLGFALWRFNCFEDYTGMTRLSETDNTYSDTRKSDLSLYPTPHQHLPPMFAGDAYDKYLDGDLPPKYNDTTRVDVGGAAGFGNRSFVRDGELMDLDSDEEIVMSLPDDGKSAARHSSNIRPRDVFEV